MPSREGYFDPDREAQSNEHWIPWLQHQLLLHNVLTQAVELPQPYKPDYKAWKETVEQFQIDEETVLIGHSCGAGFLLRWLSENKKAASKLILVALWLDPEDQLSNNFFDFVIDSQLAERINDIYIFVSANDDQDVIDSVEIIEKRLKDTHKIAFENKGHFTYNDMQTREFSALRDVALD